MGLFGSRRERHNDKYTAQPSSHVIAEAHFREFISDRVIAETGHHYFARLRQRDKRLQKIFLANGVRDGMCHCFNRPGAVKY